jgi:very-short-patch-repair endonuclease
MSRQQPAPTVFEREFVARVLRNVPGLEAADVHPQYGFRDHDGRQRRIDFALLVGAARVAVEIDGLDKTTKTGVERQRLHEDSLARQNALVGQGWRVLRFSNGQVMHQSAACARQIAAELADPRESATSAISVRPTPPVVEVVERQTSPVVPTTSRAVTTAHRSQWVKYGVLAGVALLIAVAILATRHGGGTSGQVSEAAQRSMDLSNGAAAPLPDGRTCPSKYPIKANYREDRGTRYYFTPSNPYYNRTTPTSCWSSASQARSGGYTAP